VLPQSFPDGQATWTWGAPLPPSLATTVSASPTLTCNTRKPGTKTGVLSIATESGWLVTYLVDSRGLDPTAPWPKYGHDVRNTNNAATPIETCP
jgi:hypothetical protein